MAIAVFYAGEVGDLVETFARMYVRESEYSQVSGWGLLEIACSLKWSVSWRKLPPFDVDRRRHQDADGFDGVNLESPGCCLVGFNFSRKNSFRHRRAATCCVDMLKKKQGKQILP